MDRAASLALLVVVPAGADPAPWIRAVAAAPAELCSLVLAYPRGATAPDPAIETVFCAQGASIFHLWGAAIARAAGAYVAVLDARCPPAAGWVAGARRAIADGVPAFFGPVTFSQGGEGHALVEYVLEYAQFARPIAAGMGEVPGNNLVFRRDLLGADDLRDQQFHKVFFVDRLKRQGLAPLLRDDVEVIYEKRYRRLHYLKRRYAHGRTYAALRSADQGFGFRVLRALTSPALPFLRLFRITNSLRGKLALQGALLRHPAYALAAETAWSFGECAGYLSASPGDPAYLD